MRLRLLGFGSEDCRLTDSVSATRYFLDEGAMKLYASMLALAAPALGQVPHQHHPPLSSEEYARVLEDPSWDAQHFPFFERR